MTNDPLTLGVGAYGALPPPPTHPAKFFQGYKNRKFVQTLCIDIRKYFEILKLVFEISVFEISLFHAQLSMNFFCS